MMMLGELLAELADAARAERALAEFADAAALARVQEAAQAHGVATGAYVATAVRHLLDHGGEELWLDLIGRMSGSPQPGAAAMLAILARAFPDPVRVRITRSHARA
jgi:hypothetical protein